MANVIEIISEIWLVTARMSAFLLLGFLVAGLLSVFISPAWLQRHLGRRGSQSVFKASLFGVPLPLCSCGVIPVSASLRQQGASKAATTSFLISTPQTGVDSILVTWTMLGPLFAVFRPLVALVTGFLGGWLVQIFDRADGMDTELPDSLPGVTPNTSSLAAKVLQALDYGLITLPGDIGKALLVGVIIAGVLGALIPADFLAGFLGRGPLSIGLMMLAGIPLYVCATASVPLAASFLFLGATPGAALAFLIAGPATNAATVTTVNRVLGRRTMVIYLLTIALSSFGAGLLLDWLGPRAAVIPIFSGHENHLQDVGWFDHLSALALVVVMTFSWWRSRSGCACVVESASGPPAQELELVIAGMHCSHCARSVEQAVEQVEGVTRCLVVMAEGKATIQGVGLDAAVISGVVESLGYQVSTRTIPE